MTLWGMASWKCPKALVKRWRTQKVNTFGPKALIRHPYECRWRHTHWSVSLLIAEEANKKELKKNHHLTPKTRGRVNKERFWERNLTLALCTFDGFKFSLFSNNLTTTEVLLNSQSDNIISMVLFSLRILFFISTGRLHLLHLLHLLFFPRLSLSLLASWTPWLHFFSCFIFFFFHTFCLSFFDSEQWAPIFFHQFFSCLTSPHHNPCPQFAFFVFIFYFIFLFLFFNCSIYIFFLKKVYQGFIGKNLFSLISENILFVLLSFLLFKSQIVKIM